MAGEVGRTKRLVSAAYHGLASEARSTGSDPWILVRGHRFISLGHCPLYARPLSNANHPLSIWSSGLEVRQEDL